MKPLYSTISRIALLAIASSVLISACSSSTTDQQASPSSSATSPVASSTTSGSSTPGTQSGTNDPIASGNGNSKSSSSPLDLIQNSQVQKELNLKPQQITDLKKADVKLRENVGKIVTGVNWTQLKGDKSKQKELEDKVLAETKQASDAMQKLLEPQQRNRFKEISLQVYGFGILSYDQFTKDLNLTSDQQKTLEALRQDTSQKIRANLESPESNAPEALDKARTLNQKRVEEILQASNQQAEAVLTPSQKTKLETLKGKPFTLASIQVPSQLLVAVG